jgi:hypothetical protein
VYYLRINADYFKNPHYIMRVAMDDFKEVYDIWINVKHKSTLSYKNKTNAIKMKNRILLYSPKLKITIEKIEG